MRKTQMRAAVAMIELIFALVIIGLVLLTAPMIVSTATKSGYVALQQESISTAATEISMILSNHWDEADTNSSDTIPILITGGWSPYDINTSTGQRNGTPTPSKRSFYTSLATGTKNATPVSNFTTESDFDDIDDYHGNDSNFTHISSTSIDIGDYIDTKINIRTNVSYISDIVAAATVVIAGRTTWKLDFNSPFTTSPPAGTGPTTNIKMVNVQLTTSNTSDEMAKNIVMRAFSCNIGTYELRERTF